MSKGPGAIERRIADLFAATRDRALSIDDVTDDAFALSGKPPTRARRISVTRAAHRMLRRVQEAWARHRQIVNQSHADTEAALGREQRVSDEEYETRLVGHPLWAEQERLWEFCWRIGIWSRSMRGEADLWRTTTLKGRLYFHPPDVPVEVWAVTVDETGVHWFDAEVTRITERNVVVRYRGESARLNRDKLRLWWAWWRGVMFVSSRTGRIADKLNDIWWRRYGARGSVPPQLQMPLADAKALLGITGDYTRDDVVSAFRRKAKEAHPDLGGTAEQFRILVEARDRLLAALGTSAPPPKMPQYAPTGTQIVYRSGRRSSLRLTSATPRLR